ncbi:unnamed protein product [Lymnaea stagnalis]|uniref:Fringe-like glycosyltransferase domain-containing protein n=1 Tax=Lymnaea stagnalis TaxID=6523 RepID=A0AAV2I266_LYMST
MRLSPKKVVKYTIFLLFFMVLNVWISYSVNIWSFNNFDDREKVLQSFRERREDNGGALPVPPVIFVKNDYELEGVGNKPNIEESDFFRKQRSAKEFPLNSDTNDLRQNQLFIKEKKVVAQIGKKIDANLLLHEGSNKSSLPEVGTSNIQSNGHNRVSLPILKPKKIQQTELSDVFISVKTTSKYHTLRVNLLLKTWYLLAREQVYFFTDSNEQELIVNLGGHLVNTNCSSDHSRRALSCKMAVEFDYYMTSRKRQAFLFVWTCLWFCHMDDDVYLNVPRLVEVLRGYNYKEDWYLGKPSLKHPLEVVDRDNPGMKLTFWFATGGAGFCISRSLALKMAPYAGGGRFVTTAEKVRLPDDCTIGYIIEHLLKHKLTVIEEFHSHLEALWLIKPNQLKKQITLSFSEYSGKQNVINIQGFNDTEDPTRLLSLHCFLFPNFNECRHLT